VITHEAGGVMMMMMMMMLLTMTRRLNLPHRRGLTPFALQWRMEDEFGDRVTIDSPPFIYENLRTRAVATTEPSDDDDVT
jgi:hypothetical protein